MFIKKITNHSSLIVKLFKNLFVPYQFGFIRGHSYITDQQVHSIKDILYNEDGDEVVSEYEKKFAALIGNGRGISFAAGRMAFYSILHVLNIGPGDEVILPGFTCSVMPNAIWRVGATPVYTDIDPETFGSDAKAIKTKLTSRTKLIVAQHSFGIPCHIKEITDLGRKSNIPVVEDCAISLASSFEKISVGNWGDAAIFSTDHTKPLNTLIGGLLYTNNEKIYNKIKTYSQDLPELDDAHKRRIYRQFLFERKYYSPQHYPKAALLNYIRSIKGHINLGSRLYTFLESDYTSQSLLMPYPYPAQMPSFLAQLGLYELERWPLEKKARKSLMSEYLRISNEVGLAKCLPSAYFDNRFDIVPLRFVFQHPEKKKIMRKIEKNLDVESIWFQSPVICSPTGIEDLGYVLGSCRLSEKAGKHIINWPCVILPGWERKIMELFRYASTCN